VTTLGEISAKVLFIVNKAVKIVSF